MYKRQAVSSIPHGFTIYDQEDRLVMCNEAHLNFYSNCRDVLTPGTNVEDTLRHAAQQGLVRDAVGRCDEWIEERLELSLIHI